MTGLDHRLFRAGALLAVLGCAVLLAGSRPAHADDDYRALMDELSGYRVRPRQHRAALLRIARTRAAGLPSEDVLWIGEMLLRAGEPRVSARLYRIVLGRTVDTETAGWAHFGLGWVLLAGGDFPAARREYDAIVAGGWGSRTATAILALIAASEGHGARAVRTLEEIVRAPDISPGLVMVGMLGGGYARYWMGDYRGAAIAFDVAALAHPTSRLVDDARYGAAWAAYRAGDRDAAVAALTALARSGHGATRRAGRRLARLEPHAVFREGLRRFRDAPPSSGDDGLVSLLDLDGPALARAALAEVAGAPASSVRPRVPTPAAVEEKRAAKTPQAAPDSAPGAMRHGGLPAVIAVLVVLALALLALARSRRRRATPIS